MYLRKIKTNRLIKRNSNGLITAGDEKKSENILRDSESDNNCLNRLDVLEKDLEKIRLIDEPIDVTYHVMNKVKEGKTTKTPISSITGFFRTMLRPAPVSLAIALVLGLILGSAFTWLIVSNNTSTNEQVLSGTIIANPKEGFSFSNNTTDLGLNTFKIGNLHYLNVTINTEEDLQMEVSFKETDFRMMKSGYISFRGKEKDTYDKGTVLFYATGKTSFQIVLEKLNNQLAGVNISAASDKTMVLYRQVFLK
jgi:hypothetical protein